MRVGIVRFLGTNCDFDCRYACDTLGIDSDFIWHEQTHIEGFDAVILPGGFSYGDYLRCGALAKFSPIMKAIGEFAKKGGYVMGICNGFQILLESGLLKGSLLKNKNLRFIHKDVYLRVEDSRCYFTDGLAGKTLKMPIAHGDGNYFCSEDYLKYLQDNEMIVLRYASKQGDVSDECNPNGSIYNIAGICNEDGNVFGLMPHPERAVGDLGNDGEYIWERLLGG
ncbi:phosphoribosylformylglycinamidine synthase I [Hippea maritima]|uniref:Phosphoribosylformylglycinamidine synthase subunit PurQ n=1 Tax=Hippea maritima (strain ATCC 700847 / DSM 10411 / MH2) TaxID=760142 RepID=F2LVN0_HIPMA|nr:phosphoribosylformylglycinamidine synthase I [Hippea maritima]AEA33814.1 Phosphoribosylformylglycinamidine synthase 1 [Hippea maritima DSM 10411]